MLPTKGVGNCCAIKLVFHLILRKTGGRLCRVVERHEILGTTLFGGYEGVDYSEGQLDERWLVEPYGCGRANQFEWDFENGQQDWTMKRYAPLKVKYRHLSPDMFPRLLTTVKPTRLELCASATPSKDILSRCPDVVFLNISSHVPLPDLYTISILSKTIRHRCLTMASFQNIVRQRLFKTWATPIQSEYLPQIKSGYPHHTSTGDWLLYGYHVYKTASMRNCRRRILDLINQQETQFHLKAIEQGYSSGPNSEHQQTYLRAIIDQQLILRKLNEMYDFELFVKAATILNNAYREDLTQPRLMGTKLPGAVKKVKKLMVGKVALKERRPGRTMNQKIVEIINERFKFNVIENQVWSRPRVAKSQGEAIFD